MFYLPEYPWITNSCTADHDTINPITIFIFQCFLRAVNIAITENWDVNAWVVFYFGDQRPVGLAFIQLASCAAMNANA